MKKILNYLGAIIFAALLGLNVYSSLDNPNLFVTPKALAQTSSNSSGSSGTEDCFIDCYSPCDENCAFNVSTGKFEKGIERRICP